MELMVVDDSALVRERLVALLSGIDGVGGVLQAECGDRALDLLRVDAAHAVRFVVLDIEMPGENGLDVLRRIKASRADVRVAMFSQHADSQHRARSIARGADYFFDKISEIDQLETTVRQLVALSS